MQVVIPPGHKGWHWLTPAVVGVLLILIGVLIYREPKLLAYFVAAMFVLAGTALVAVAWKMRRRITYRRIDEAGRNEHPDD